MSARPVLREIAEAAQACRADGLARLAASAALAADAELEEIRRAAPPPPLACQAGCSWCCHVLVVVTVAEVARLVRHLGETLDAEAYAALHQRCATLAAERRTMSAVRWNRARHPCPLLVDARCSVYPVRPLACRGAVSVDAAACQAEHERRAGALPVYAPQQQIYGYVREALARGLSASGGPGPVELIPALAIGMRLPPERFLDPRAWTAAEYVPRGP